MSNIFSSVDKFFASLNSYIGQNEVFIIFVGLFLLVVIGTIIATSHSYEAKLVKAIDMLNGYFVNNPKITEDNLVLFNQIMRNNKVPNLLRKHWQQYVLYREHNASFYMSFENCVSIPLRNSRFKRDKITMNLLSYIFATCALILNAYFTPETTDVAYALSKILLAPVLILLVNFIVTIFLDLKENAIVSDLHQNYEYFEVNIDKATQTLPEYVDYEILFDKNEIKKGIPVLYAYLQKRAEEEQRELEKARLRNVEHEKFNFDEAGLAGSLVLERAMQEAENYIAERKKYNQDIEQINSEITQEDMNYREITKEYNRQMQVSKETFANFKKELEEASSSIQANYLKKQQQQELDRQRNLERDFDTATDRHKKVIESYQAELDSVDKFIAESRKALQDAMMAEFATYSSKVYDEAKKVVEEREKEKYAKVKQEIKNLEEEIHSKNKELKNYSGTQESETENNSFVTEEPEDSEPKEIQPEFNKEDNTVMAPVWEQTQEVEQSEAPTEKDWDSLFENTESKETETMSLDEFDKQTNETSEEQSNIGVMSLEDFDKQNDSDNSNTISYNEYLQEPNLDPFKVETSQEEQTDNIWGEQTINSDDQSENEEENQSTEEGDEFSWFDDMLKESTVQEEESKVEGENKISSEEEGEDENPDDEDGALEIKVDDVEENPAERKETEVLEGAPVKRKVGRPRKVVTEQQKPKGKPGRPKKVKKEVVEKKKPGRPRKVEVEEAPKRKVGRPKKISSEPVKAKKRGRPKKVEENKETTKKVGRPKNSVTKKRVGRPRKVVTESETIKEPKRKVGRPKKTNLTPVKSTKKGRGRPKKIELTNVDSADVDLEAYLKVIDNAIARENAKMKRSQKALESNANIKTKNKK